MNHMECPDQDNSDIKQDVRNMATMVDSLQSIIESADLLEKETEEMMDTYGVNEEDKQKINTSFQTLLGSMTILTENLDALLNELERDLKGLYVPESFEQLKTAIN